MDRFLDELARALAGPLPRRNAIKVVGLALFGGFIVTLNDRVQAQSCSPACPPKKVCCPGNFCVTQGKQCGAPCGDKACDAKKTCCPGATEPFCATVGKTCCGDKACGPKQRCEDGRCEASK